MKIEEDYYPIEYKKGEVIFFGRRFTVSPHVLIPRLDTEGLVRRARSIIKTSHIDTVIDIGAWSGIIGVSCADLVDTTIFLDISDQALLVARENYERNFPGKSAIFLSSDLLSDLPSMPSSGVLLVANLPYIKDGDWGHMSPDTQYEPELALFWWAETGFELYQKLFLQIQERAFHGTLLIEFGFDQRQVAENVLQGLSWEYHFFSDYSGIERFAEIRIGI